MSSSFMQTVEQSKNYVTHTMLFNQLKTGDPIIDTFLTTFVLGLFSWIVTWICEHPLDGLMANFTMDDIKSHLFKKNTIIIEGKKSTIVSSYNATQHISSAYSDRFKAVWNHIIANVQRNNTIYKIKENHSNFQSSSNNPRERCKNADLFMVYQNRHFLIDDHIYAKSEVDQDRNAVNNDKTSVKTDRISITIYSYKYSMPELIQYIDRITEAYLRSIKDVRCDKQFIYSLDKVELSEDDDPYDCWREDVFESARTFDNIFFDGKQALIDKINFFINNKSWYYEKGIPYSLGIGLHGPPGTGKTSFIKALANYTNRHIIVISLKLIKTKAQLEKMFFENTYNDDNEDNTVTWDKKIIVFEDIDCIGDIILNREEKQKQMEQKEHRIRPKSPTNGGDAINVGDIIQSICDINDKSSTSLMKEMKEMKNPSLTLDDILNLWDGIRETPGRIMIISSNHYDKLDPALVRSGRIDITHELSNASHAVIAEMYTRLFGATIDADKLSKVHDKFYSPAEIINLYVSCKTEDAFLERLLENKKV